VKSLDLDDVHPPCDRDRRDYRRIDGPRQWRRRRDQAVKTQRVTISRPVRFRQRCSWLLLLFKVFLFVRRTPGDQLAQERSSWTGERPV
jgi:hypothetical protein